MLDDLSTSHGRYTRGSPKTSPVLVLAAMTSRPTSST
jgi:hypothetical protein